MLLVLAVEMLVTGLKTLFIPTISPLILVKAGKVSKIAIPCGDMALPLPELAIEQASIQLLICRALIPFAIVTELARPLLLPLPVAIFVTGLTRIAEAASKRHTASVP